jgi:hypothetical protein
MPLAHLFATLFAFLLSPLASATSWSTDISDLWWNPAESGWGMQITQTYNTAFVTIYAYRADRSPVWFSATITGSISKMTGDLYETAGPYFGGAFNPAQVSLRKVGTLTFKGVNISDAKVTYSVDGVVVNKDVERQALVFEDNAGLFKGAASARLSAGSPSCGPHFAPGKGMPAEVEIAQPGRSSAMQVQLRIAGNSCTMANGEYLQLGRLGDVYGAFTCASGDRGNLYVYEMRTGFESFTARFEYESTVTGCIVDGDFAGVRM